MMNGSSAMPSGIYYAPQGTAYGSQGSGTSPMGSKTANKHSDMFPTPKWRDLWAALLFYLHLGGLAAVSVFTFTRLESAPMRDILEGESVTYYLVCLSVAVLVAVFASALSLRLMYDRPEGSLHGAFIGNILVHLSLSIGLFVVRNIVGGVLFLIMGILGAFFYLVFRKRIPFSAILLKTVIKCLETYPTMLLVNLASLFMAIAYLIWWSATAGVLAFHLNKRKETDALTLFLLIYTAFSGFWTSQVLSNTAQTAVAGVYATYYFLHGTGQVIVNPVATSLRRALTFSFGSICFGSLIVAILQTIRFLVQLFNDRESIAACIVDCILSIIEGLVRYFNYFAYTQIAIYGKPYIEAAKDTFDLIKNRGLDLIVNDSIVSTCLGLASLLISIVAGAVVYLISTLIYAYPWERSLFLAIVAGLFAAILTNVVFEIVAAGCTTTIVCLAEDPEALRRSKPELYNFIMQKYSMITF